MTRDECSKALANASPVTPHDEVSAAILATLLRIEAQGDKPAPTKRTTRTRKKTTSKAGK